MYDLRITLFECACVHCSICQWCLCPRVKHAQMQHNRMLSHAERVAAYQDVIVDELMYVVCIPTIIHGILEGSQVLAMHVEHNISDPVHPPAPQPQVPLKDASAHFTIGICHGKSSGCATHVWSLGNAPRSACVLLLFGSLAMSCFCHKLCWIKSAERRWMLNA